MKMYLDKMSSRFRYTIIANVLVEIISYNIHLELYVKNVYLYYQLYYSHILNIADIMWITECHKESSTDDVDLRRVLC